MGTKSIEEELAALGFVFTAEHSVAVVAAGGSLAVGFTTGINQIVALRRSYASSGALLTINLYEAIWSGGSNVLRTYNRNLASAKAIPMQMKAGVAFTPNTPISSAVARAATSTGNANLTVPEEDPLFLKSATSYVVEFVNGDAGSVAIGLRINFRERQLSDAPG